MESILNMNMKQSEQQSKSKDILGGGCFPVRYFWFLLVSGLYNFTYHKTENPTFSSEQINTSHGSQQVICVHRMYKVRILCAISGLISYILQPMHTAIICIIVFARRGNPSVTLQCRIMSLFIFDVLLRQDFLFSVFGAQLVSAITTNLWDVCVDVFATSILLLFIYPFLLLCLCN